MSVKTSIVLDLQRDALNKDICVADLIRKALVVAKKLEVKEFEDWAKDELNGYLKKNNEQIPAYRHVNGEIKIFNPYNGWIPLCFENENHAEKLWVSGHIKRKVS